MEQQHISSRDMHALEVNAEYFGISLLQLMENAGRSVAAEICRRYQKDQRVVIFCGIGGNGGDGFVAARHLLSLGFSRVAVVLVGKGKDITHPAAKANWVILQQLASNLPIVEASGLSDLPPKVEIDVAVDALLGTGTKGKLKPPISDFVMHINSLKSAKVAVDVPTGVDSDRGEVLGVAVKADVTVTFYKSKTGLEKARTYAGDVVVADIGLPADLETFAGPGDIMLATKTRAASAHKGDSGKALFVGGSDVFSGAPALMSMAALRAGLDVAYTASPEKTAHDIAAMSPDFITVKLEGNHLNPKNVPALFNYIGGTDAVIVGPGAGLHPDTKQFMKALVDAVEAAGKPMLLDADGLKAFAEFKRRLKVPLVLTPHAGEFDILTGRTLPSDAQWRAKEVKKAAAELGAVILLKGPVDVVSDGKRVKLNFTHNPGMTVGGTGDVLSGIVGAFLAQKVDPFEAAVAGAFVNGAAGNLVAEKVGFHMVATDLLEYIPQVLEDPTGRLKVHNSGKTT